MSSMEGSGASQLAMPTQPSELALTRSGSLPRVRRRGAREGVIELYSEHYGGLVRLAHLVAHDPSIAEDLVHEAFLKLYGAWYRIVDPDKALAYLRTTLVNLARGRARRYQVTLRRRPPPSADAASAEEDVIGLESRRAVLEALRQLPARQRACLVLRHYEDMTESQIAETLGIAVGSVRTHVKRGMAALERRLGAQQ
jgi:RNA polymerase sigma-70 factor (sigma-E family)